MKKVERKIDDKVTDLHKKQKEIDEKITENMEKQEARFLKIENELQNKITNQKNNDKAEEKRSEIKIEKKIENELKVYMDNKHDKENRKNNIVILRLQEQNGDNVKEQIEKDRQEVKKLFDITNPELKAELNNIINEKKTFRLGKYKKPGKIRPIKIELPDKEMKIDILKGCKNLKDSAFEHISVQHDLTKDEQEEHYKLRKELRTRREAGEDVCIYNNEIIKRSDHPNNQPESSEDQKDDQEEENKDETKE